MMLDSPPVAVNSYVWKIVTFGSVLAGNVLFSLVLSPLKWYKEAKDEDKTSHCEIVPQRPRELSPFCLTFFFPQSDVETAMKA